jgi:ATP/maltotriose-dependent transcriptional regulator MalT
MLRGAALVEQDGAEEAIARIREGVTKWTRLGHTFFLPHGSTFLAEGLARHGDRVAARTALREGLERADATGEYTWDAELYRLTGTVLLAENKLDEGQASLRQAIHIAQAQQVKSLELRAARDLARLWGEQGRRAEARDLLAPVYGWFTEGFDTADLKDAKALLAELNRRTAARVRASLRGLTSATQDQLPITMMAAGLPQLVGQAGRAKPYAERLFEFMPMDRPDAHAAQAALCVPAGQRGDRALRPASRQNDPRRLTRPYSGLRLTIYGQILVGGPVEHNRIGGTGQVPVCRACRSCGGGRENRCDTERARGRLPRSASRAAADQIWRA